MVDTTDLKSVGESCEGSNPSTPTITLTAEQVDRVATVLSYWYGIVKNPYFTDRHGMFEDTKAALLIMRNAQQELELGTYSSAG